jgi:hypothetical protein
MVISSSSVSFSSATTCRTVEISSVFDVALSDHLLIPACRWRAMMSLPNQTSVRAPHRRA